MVRGLLATSGAFVSQANKYAEDFFIIGSFQLYKAFIFFSIQKPTEDMSLIVNPCTRQLPGVRELLRAVPGALAGAQGVVPLLRGALHRQGQGRPAYGLGLSGTRPLVHA